MLQKGTKSIVYYYDYAIFVSCHIVPISKVYIYYIHM